MYYYNTLGISLAHTQKVSWSDKATERVEYPSL